MSDYMRKTGLSNGYCMFVHVGGCGDGGGGGGGGGGSGSGCQKM